MPDVEQVDPCGQGSRNRQRCHHSAKVGQLRSGIHRSPAGSNDGGGDPLIPLQWPRRVDHAFEVLDQESPARGELASPRFSDCPGIR